MGSNIIDSGRTMIRVGDIDIDLADRQQVLNLIQHTPAAIHRDQEWIKHNTGIYVTDIPRNPVNGISGIDYQAAEARGYVKLDLLNNSVYQHVRDRSHLKELTDREPNWNKLWNQEFFQRIVHISNHYNLYCKLAQPVACITDMAMFLALIRPAKRHLVGLPWNQIQNQIWQPDAQGVYGYKKAHAMSYALLVSVHMNIVEQESN